MAAFVLARNSPLLPPLRRRLLKFADANGDVYDKAARDTDHRPCYRAWDLRRIACGKRCRGADAVARGEAAKRPDAVQAAMRDLPYQQCDRSSPARAVVVRCDRPARRLGRRISLFGRLRQG